MCTGLVSSIAFYFSCRFVSQRQWVWWSGSPCITLQQTALNDSIAVHLIELCDRSVAEEFGYQAFVVNLKHNAFHNLYPELKNQFQSWPDFSRVVIRKAVQEFRTITTAVPFFFCLVSSVLCDSLCMRPQHAHGAGWMVSAELPEDWNQSQGVILMCTLGAQCMLTRWAAGNWSDLCNNFSQNINRVAVLNFRLKTGTRWWSSTHTLCLQRKQSIHRLQTWHSYN